jgi:hypothetical protein
MAMETSMTAGITPESADSSSHGSDAVALSQRV